VKRSDGSTGTFLEPDIRGRVALIVIQTVFWEKEPGRKPYVRVKVKPQSRAVGAYYAADISEPLL
jgi:hypothetical protein